MMPRLLPLCVSAHGARYTALPRRLMLATRYAAA